MELRILRGHEIKEAAQLFYNDQQSLLEVLTLSRQKKLFFIGAFEKKLVGVIGIYEFQHIKYLCVLESYRHQGIASDLIRKAIQLSCDDLYVTVSQTLEPLYKQLGFEILEDQLAEQKLVYRHQIQKRFTHYQQVHDFIASQKQRVYALDNFKRFMKDMGNPQILLKSIHIGGTNGKGSTTNYIRSVLQNAGYKVATFTSPVLVTRLEIMRINNQHIQEDEIITYANRYMDLCLEYELSMFEIEVFIAIMFFIKHRVDFAVFEVGLGGDLDATNIIYPMICANTNIGLDHVEYLGNTYEQIARTKAGIVKEGIPYVTGEKKSECLNVFQNICDKLHSPLIQTRHIENIQDHGYYLTYDYRHYHVRLNTSAIYQCQNSALAIEILEYLKEYEYLTYTDEQLLNGLLEATWAGRFETVCQHPLIIIDGAHNKEGIEAFYQSAKKYSHIKIIFSALKDKDTHAMMEMLLKLTDDITVCEFDFYRAQTVEKLAENFPVKIEKDWHKAIDQAFLHEGVVFVTGSLYFLAQVRPYILEHQKNK